MNENLSSSDRTVVVNRDRTLWFLSIASLSLNALVLLLLLGFALHHHHHHGHGRFGGGGGRGPECCAHFGGPRGFEHHGFGGGPGQGFEGGNPPPPEPGAPHDETHKGPPNPAEFTDRIMDHLTGQLTLTDPEKTQIRPIIQDELQKQMAERRDAMKKAFDETKAKIRPLLTPDQQKQLDAVPLPGEHPAK